MLKVKRLEKITIIQQNRKLNFKEVFRNPLGHIPWSRTTKSTCEFVKTSKSASIREMEKAAPAVERFPLPFAALIDGIAMVRKLKCRTHL